MPPDGQRTFGGVLGCWDTVHGSFGAGGCFGADPTCLIESGSGEFGGCIKALGFFEMFFFFVEPHCPSHCRGLFLPFGWMGGLSK